MNLYVGNISASVQHAELLHMFEGMGEVLYARLGESKATAGDTGYAFVYVPNEELDAQTKKKAANNAAF